MATAFVTAESIASLRRLCFKQYHNIKLLRAHLPSSRFRSDVLLAVNHTRICENAWSCNLPQTDSSCSAQQLHILPCSIRRQPTATLRELTSYHPTCICQRRTVLLTLSSGWCCTSAAILRPTPSHSNFMHGCSALLGSPLLALPLHALRVAAVVRRCRGLTRWGHFAA
jgi:hypothetical protein